MSSNSSQGRLKELEEILKIMRKLVYLALGIAALMVFTIMLKLDVISFSPSFETTPTSVTIDVDTSLYGSIDAESGLVIDAGFDLVKGQCGVCHSTRLVAQNRLTREGWTDLIRWMQAEQNLWDLGEHEETILDYLEKNCAPTAEGRRRNLANVEWYVLDE